MLSKKILMGTVALISAVSMTTIGATLQKPLKSGFMVGLDGGFFQQSDEGTEYAVVDSSASTATPPVGPVKTINPNFEFSGGGFIGYLFKNKTDVAFSFFINDHSKTNFVGEGSGQHIDPILLHTFWGVDDANSASSKFSYKTNLYNILMGHWIALSNRLDVHPFWGVNVSDLHNGQETTYDGISGNAAQSGTVFENSSVTGVGPVIGVNGHYDVWKHIGIVWGGDIGMLVGNIKSSFLTTNNFAQSNPNLTETTNLSIFELMQAQLGLGYQFAVKQTPVQFSAGYRVTEYLGATQSHVLGDDVADGFSQHFLEDSGFSGPFMSLSAVI